MLTGKMPWAGMPMQQIMMAVAVQFRVPAVPEGAPEEDLLRRCFARAPRDRPTAAQLAEAFAPADPPPAMANMELEQILQQTLEANERLEERVAQLRLDKHREEMRRLEAESTLQSVERRANELQSQVCLSMFAQGVQNPWTVANLDVGLSLHTGIDVDVKCVQMEQMHLQGRGGVDPNRLVQLEQQLQNSEERRKEEEKKRAIAEGKHRHLENQMKQQVHVLCAKRVAITT